MAKKEVVKPEVGETEEVNPISSNPTLVEWPSDVDGITGDLKRALVDAAGRLNGRQDKLEILLATIRVGVLHTRARFASQVEENAHSAAWREQQEAVRTGNRRSVGWQA